jgi:hypothetical protein
MILAGSSEFFAITGAADAQGRQFCSAAWPAAVNKRPTTAAAAASLMTRRMVFQVPLLVIDLATLLEPP